jgi:hypothetical protein
MKIIKESDNYLTVEYGKNVTVSKCGTVQWTFIKRAHIMPYRPFRKVFHKGFRGFLNKVLAWNEVYFHFLGARISFDQKEDRSLRLSL